MNTKILHDQLVRRIQHYGSEAREHRQMYRRLVQLLPDRYRELAQQFRASDRSSSDAARAASVSEDLLAHIEEVVHFCGSSFEARIQYETHMMLIDARRTLRASQQTFRK